MKPSRRPQIWFLTGSQGLYGLETLNQVAAQSQQIAAALNDSADLQAEVRWCQVVTDADAIRHTCRRRMWPRTASA
jgi:L-arabinose isomerase